MVPEMTSSTKRKTLIFLGLVMITTVLIAAGLPQLKLQPGMPLPSIEHGRLVTTQIGAVPLVTITISQFEKTFFALLLAGITIFVIFRLTRGLDWRKLGSILTPIMISLSIAGILLFLITLLLSDTPSFTPMELPTPLATPLATSPLGPVPPLLLWLVGIGLLVISCLSGIWIFGSAPRRSSTIDLVGLEAEKAWQALKTGLDLKEVIIQCYRQMSLALEQEQGLERQEWMTTREFEDLLEAAGIPHDPIHQLTQIFESVRYGNWQPNSVDEQKATRCLQAIMVHSREAKKIRLI